MPYIEQYTAMSVTSASTYFITSEGNVYYKLNRDTFYNELQGLFGTSIGALATLSDVDVTGLVTGSLLRYNGSQWVDTAVADYFQNGGNAGGAARTLGNTDNYNLGFLTNNVERVRILDTGQVGIGSTTDNDIDDCKLFVQDASTAIIGVYKSGTASSTANGYEFYLEDSAGTRLKTAMISSYYELDTAGKSCGGLVIRLKQPNTNAINTQNDFIKMGVIGDGITNPYYRNMTIDANATNAGIGAGVVYIVGDSDQSYATDLFGIENQGASYAGSVFNMNSTGQIALYGQTPTSFFTMAASDTNYATLNIPVGTAPTSPDDGDIWREDNTNTGLKIRVNGVTKTITLS